MFDFKMSGIAAGAAFILSFALGLLFSGAGVLVPLIRAFIFAVVFFGLFCLGYWLVTQFLPELLNPGMDDLGLSSPGSRVDISLGDERITGAFPTDNSEVVDDITGKPPAPARSAVSTQTTVTPLDQGADSGYNPKGSTGDNVGSSGSADEESFSGGAFSGADVSGSADALPDIDGLADGMPVNNAADSLDPGAAEYESSEPRRPASSSRNSGMAGDFDPKELAQAIQTVLKKEEKG